MTVSVADPTAQLDAQLRAAVRRDEVDPQAEETRVRALAAQVVADHDRVSLTGAVAPITDPDAAVDDLVARICGFGPLQPTSTRRSIRAGSRSIRSQAAVTWADWEATAAHHSSSVRPTVAGPPYVTHPSPWRAARSNPLGPPADSTMGGGSMSGACGAGWTPSKRMWRPTQVDDPSQRARTAETVSS